MPMCTPGEPVSSRLFAYSVNRSASFLPGLDIDVDALHETETKPVDNVYIVSPSIAQDDNDKDTPHHYPPLASTPSSDDNFIVSPLAVSSAGATEDTCKTMFRVSRFYVQAHGNVPIGSLS